MAIKMSDRVLDQYLIHYKVPEVGTPLDDVEAMNLAFNFAFRGIGRTAPNPLVGAVLTDSEGGYLGGGAHLQYGGPHAEINAIHDVSVKGLTEKLDGGTLYVTLEPCCHHGNTPPCLDAIVKLPIKKVVFAYIDQSEKVKGKSIHALTEKGFGCEQRLPATLYHSWLTRLFTYQTQENIPWIAIKVAMSLDGTVARQGDQRVFITGERAREYGHFLRAYFGAIMVSSSCLLSDRPRLNARHPLCGEREIAKVIWDPMGSGLLRYKEVEAIIKDWKIDLTQASEPPMIWVCGASSLVTQRQAVETLEKCGVSFIGEDKITTNSPPTAMKAGIRNILRQLVEQGIKGGLLLEGGPSLWTPFMREKMLNSGHLFFSPQIMLGEDRINVMKNELYSEVLENIKMNSCSLASLNDDFLLEGIF